MKEVSTESQPLIFEETGKYECLSRIKVDHLTIEQQGWSEEEVKHFLTEEMKCHAPTIGRTFEEGDCVFGKDEAGNWSIYGILRESPFFSLERKDRVRQQRVPSIGDTFKAISKNK